MFKRIPLLLRILIIQILFLILHYLYDWFPSSFTSIFSGIDESVYQHMKIGFFAFTIFIIIEFFITRKNINNYEQHIFSRLFAATYFPLVMMVIYLLGPLVFGRFYNIVFEILFANIALIGTTLATLILQDQLSKINPGNGFRFVTIALFILSIIQFLSFTSELPWFDIFAIPPGY